MSEDLLALLVFLGVSSALLLTGSFFSRLFRPGVRPPPEPPFSRAADRRPRLPVRPYLAVVFCLVLEVALLVLLAWAASFRPALQEGRLVLWEPMIFSGALLIGLIYAWRRGGFGG